VEDNNDGVGNEQENWSDSQPVSICLSPCDLFQVINLFIPVECTSMYMNVLSSKIFFLFSSVQILGSQLTNYMKYAMQ